MPGKGKICTINVRDTDRARHAGWHVVLIARSPKKLQHLINDGRLEHVPELAPSPELLSKVMDLKRNWGWNLETFQSEFAWEYLQESFSKSYRDALNDLYVRVVKKDENVALTCLCSEDETCHRSIVLGLLQAIGVPYAGNKNFSSYWLQRRLIETGSVMLTEAEK